MDKQSIYPLVDHTQLKAFATWQDIETLCKQAIVHHTASVCVAPCFVKPIKEQFGGKLTICTVIGFPLGYNTTQVKVFEAKTAVAEGADEVDMVVNIGDVKSGRFDHVTQEIASVKQAIGDKLLKVIIETCYLDEAEKIALCHAVTDAGAEYIKTSTGFGTGGATLEDIILFKQHIGSNVKIKASGGIKTKAQFEAFINEGCSRIGTSSAVDLLG